MHNHLHFRGRQIKQAARLDDLEAFVHQGSGINGDALAHLPSGVIQRFFHRDIGKLRAR